MYDLIIIGAGVAGMTAAIAANENGVNNILLIERDKSVGGLLNQCIHSGFGKSILKTEFTGPEYINVLSNKLNYHNINVKLETEVLNVSDDKVVTYLNPDEGMRCVEAKSIILASGCREQYTVSIEFESKNLLGIFTCEDAHRIINFEGYLPGKEPIITISNKWDLFIVKRFIIEGAKVKSLIINTSENFKFTDEEQSIISGMDVPFIIDGRIIQAIGDKRVEGIKIYDKHNNESTIIACDSLIMSVNHFPEIGYLKSNSIKANKKIKLHNYKTPIDGIFACGNITYGSSVWKEKDIDGIEAGIEAAKYINEL